LKKIQKTETENKWHTTVHVKLPLKQTVNHAGSLGLVVTMIEHTLRLDSTGFLTNS